MATSHFKTSHRRALARTALAAALLTAGLPALGAERPRPAAAAPRATSVAVLGDRFAQVLADGLDGQAGLNILRVTSDGYGLARPGFDAWLAGIRDRLSRPDRPTLAVLLVGAEDRDTLQDSSGRYDPGSTGWVRLYGERVDAVARLFRDAGIRLIWVGLPAVRNPDTSATYVRLNGIVRDRASHDGITYIDSFDAFLDAAGRYSPVGPDVDGTTTKLRRADGIGFTRAGARKLASFIAPEITRLGQRDAAASANDIASLTIERARDFDAALDVDVNAQIRLEAARGSGTPVMARDTSVIGPAAGPVLPLTAPPVTPDGQLARLAALRDPSATLPEPGVPKAGRTDDFSWPRH